MPVLQSWWGRSVQNDSTRNITRSAKVRKKAINTLLPSQFEGTYYWAMQPWSKAEACSGLVNTRNFSFTTEPLFPTTYKQNTCKIWGTCSGVEGIQTRTKYRRLSPPQTWKTPRMSKISQKKTQWRVHLLALTHPSPPHLQNIRLPTLTSLDSLQA